MAKLHKSKEVYKYTDTANGNKLVPVRGLYVSGTHREPWYIDHAITVTGFTSNDTTVAPYTSVERDVFGDGTLAFTGISGGGVNIVNYYSSSEELFEDSVYSDTSSLAFVGIVPGDLTIVSYYTEQESMFDSTVYSEDATLTFTGLSKTNNTTQNLQILQKPQNPQPAITLTQFISSTATIQSV